MAIQKHSKTINVNFLHIKRAVCNANLKTIWADFEKSDHASLQAEIEEIGRVCSWIFR